MPFDPDAYLAGGQQEAPPPAFDPDAYLGVEPSAPAVRGSLSDAIFEPIGAIGGAIGGEIAGGVAGAFQALNPFADEGAGAEAVAGVKKSFSDVAAPQTERGKENLKTIGDLVKSGIDIINMPISQLGSLAEMLAGQGDEQAFETMKSIQKQGIGKTLGERTFEETGSPFAASMAATAPTAAMELLGLGSLKKVRPGTRLIDDAGQPTRALQVALNEKGLVYGNLMPEVRAQIPTIADKNLVKIGSDAEKVANSALLKQIKAGGKDHALADVRLKGNRVIDDVISLDAQKQGFEKGTIQGVKMASEGTRAKMQKMLNMTERVKSNSSLSTEFRPTDIVGDSFTERLKHVRNTAESARKELNQIATKELDGVSVDPSRITQRLSDSLNDLKITLKDADGHPWNGLTGSKPQANYVDSLISKDDTSKRVINQLIDMMSEGRAPDAMKFHDMKKQLDKMIDFNKKSKDGLTDAGRDVLKDIRHELNQAIRDVNPSYARVNDTLHETLTAMDDFQKVAGSKLDMFGKGANSAIGQKMRGLISNIDSRTRLENALNKVDEVANKHGGKFNDNYKDLISFNNDLERRFGAYAKGSFKGEIESAMRAKEIADPKGFVRNKLGETGAGIVDKLRNVNEFSAFRTMEDLIKRGK